MSHEDGLLARLASSGSAPQDTRSNQFLDHLDMAHFFFGLGGGLADGSRGGDRPLVMTEVIARLAHACGLPWARCRSISETDNAQCCFYRGHAGRHCRRLNRVSFSDRESPPDPLPATFNAWLAEYTHPKGHMASCSSNDAGGDCDCPANAIESWNSLLGGGQPTSSWTSRDARISWDVDQEALDDDGHFMIEVSVGAAEGTYSSIDGEWDWSFHTDGGPMVDMDLCVKLCRIANNGERLP